MNTSKESYMKLLKLFADFIEKTNEDALDLFLKGEYELNLLKKSNKKTSSDKTKKTLVVENDEILEKICKELDMSQTREEATEILIINKLTVLKLKQLAKMLNITLKYTHSKKDQIISTIVNRMVGNKIDKNIIIDN